MQSEDRPPQTGLGSLLQQFVVPRRLDDRIRALNNRALEATDPVEVKKIHRQLRSLLREHMFRLRVLMATHPFRRERRTSRDSQDL